MITNNKELVSIIIPSYNCSKYLLESIESALNQTYRNVEVIVIDDGSTDETYKTITKYLDKIQYYYQDNKGLSASRNKGYQFSKGEYICFLDADDILLKDKIENQINVFLMNPDIGVVISDFIFIDEDGKNEIQYIKKRWDRDQISRLFNHEVFPPHAALIKREVLEKSNLFPEDIETAESQEDWQLWLELALKKVQFISYQGLTCKYRVRKGSIRLNYLKHLDGARRVVNWLKNHEFYSSYKKSIDHLETIVEMERVAAGLKMKDSRIIIENLIPAVKKWPKYWEKPHTYLSLFNKSLDNYESAKWEKEKDPGWFKNVIIKRLFLVIYTELSNRSLNRMKAAAYLMLSDLAYNTNADSIRERARKHAIEASLITCLSNNSILNFIRSIVGPDMVKRLKRLFSV